MNLKPPHNEAVRRVLSRAFVVHIYSHNIAIIIIILKKNWKNSSVFQKKNNFYNENPWRNLSKTCSNFIFRIKYIFFICFFKN